MNRITVLLAGLLMVVSCGEETVRPDRTVHSGPVDPYEDPPDYSGDPFADFPEVTGVGIPSAVEYVYEEEVLSGSHYTVQISAATTLEAAEGLADRVSAGMTHPVFIDHEGTFWKVRVGAFPLRENAIDLGRELVDMGFTDAWVTTRVHHR